MREEHELWSGKGISILVIEELVPESRKREPTNHKRKKMQLHYSFFSLIVMYYIREIEIMGKLSRRN